MRRTDLELASSQLGAHSAAELFDAALTSPWDERFARLGLEVVARPGTPCSGVTTGDLLIRRAWGEGRLAIVLIVQRPAERRAALEARGVVCQGRNDGRFIEVMTLTNGRRMGLRIAGADGAVARDSLFLRRPAARTATTEHFEPSVLPRPRVAPKPASARTVITPSVSATETLEMSEAATDPVTPILTVISLRGSVGRGGRNAPADVRAVQDRLVELRELSAADASTERPSGSGNVAEASLSRTIAAIESFQRSVGSPAGGLVNATGATLRDLNRSIPRPTAAEYTAAATRRDGISQVVSRGFSITGKVGATSTGNAPSDVQEVQRKLVELGKLSASHTEAPAAGSTASVSQRALTRTIAAIRSFQRDVEFWVGKGTISGAVTNGVVDPGDATAALLDRVSVYQMTSGSVNLTLRDHVRSGHTESTAGVMFVGTSLPSAIATADYVALGLTAAQAAALQFVSSHEGNFDAINTYDRARVSVGFIQFAGGRGLPPYLSLLKSRKPAQFRSLLQGFGIDVEFVVQRGEIQASQVVVQDTASSRVLRGAPAEEAIRADKRLSTALILSGREREVQLVQIEAAIRDYVLPALAGSVTWGSTTATLGDLLRSERAMAMLFDRAIQEGTGGGRQRFVRVIQAVHASRPAVTLADLQAREPEILTTVERDLQAGADVAAQLDRALSNLAILIRAASRSGATVAQIVGRAELEQTRQAVTNALTAAANVVTVPAADLATILRSEQTRLRFDTAPALITDLSTALTNSRTALKTALRPVANSSGFLNRIQRIRQSTLRSSLTPQVGARSVAPESADSIHQSRAAVGA